MTSIDTMPLHAQAILAHVGYTTSGSILSGTGSLYEPLQSTIQFLLPEDFDSTMDVVSATLNLYAAVSAGNHKHLVASMDSASQALPANGSELFSVSSHYTTYKYFGAGSVGPPVDYLLSTTHAWVAVDATEMVNVARAAGQLTSGRICFNFNSAGTGEGLIFNANGVGQPNPPTLTLDYYAMSPPPGGGVGINRGRINRGLINRGLLNKGSIR